jgi:type IV secretory pathway VirJ component
MLMGYSFGASALPLIAPRLPPAVLSQVRLMVLIAPMDRGELVMRPQSWFDIPDRTARPVAPLLHGLAGVKVLCVYGDRDRHAACPRLGLPAAELRLAGGHHLTGQEDAIIGGAFSAIAPRTDPAPLARDLLVQTASRP